MSINNRTETIYLECEAGDVPFCVYNYQTKTWELKLTKEQLFNLKNEIVNEVLEVENNSSDNQNKEMI